MTSPARRQPTWLIGLAGLAVVLGFLNFLWFFAESATIGDAGRGYIREGHYFLVNAGVATEVSKAAWDWSVFHGRSIFVTHPLAMLGGAYLAFTVAFPSMLGVRRGPETAIRIARIRLSGEPLLTVRTGGRLGSVRMTRPLILIAVHPGGIILSPFGLGSFGLETNAILGIEDERSFLEGSRLRIRHRQVGVPEPIELFLKAGSPADIAIRHLSVGREAPANGASAHRVEAPQRTRRFEPFSTEMKAVIVAGQALAIVFIIVVFSTGFPFRLGAFGVVWSIVVIGIFVYNAWLFFIRDRSRW
jgi:hypothetical protein